MLGANLPNAAGLDVLPADRVAYESAVTYKVDSPIHHTTLPPAPVAIAVSRQSHSIHLPVYRSIQPDRLFHFVQPQAAPPGSLYVVLDQPSATNANYPHLKLVHATSANLWDVLRTHIPDQHHPIFNPVETLDWLEREMSIFTAIELGPTVRSASLVDLNALNLDGAPGNRHGPNGLLQIIARHCDSSAPPSRLTPAHFDTIERKLLRPNFRRSSTLAAKSDKSSAQVTNIFRGIDQARAASLYSTAFPKNDPPKKTTTSGGNIKTQGVTAYPPFIQALFSAWVGGIVSWLMANLRPGLWVDFGYTEDELSAIFSAIARPYAQELDLTSQDSTHTQDHATILIHLAKLAGLDGPLSNLFMQMRAHDRVAMLDHTLTSENSWALGSGAPWTLLANCIMMLSSLALDTDFDTHMLAVQKGDDYYGSHPINPVTSSLRVFPGVNYVPRSALIGSFCSRVHAHVIVRKLSRPLGRLRELSREPEIRFAQISASARVVDDIMYMGTSYYAAVMALAFDTSVMEAHTLLAAYLAAYYHALTATKYSTPTYTKPTVKTVNPASYCFHTVLHALTNTSIASDYYAMRTHDVPRPHALRVFTQLSIPHIAVPALYDPVLLSRLIQKDLKWTGAFVFLDHVVGRTIASINPILLDTNDMSGSKSH